MTSGRALSAGRQVGKGGENPRVQYPELCLATGNGSPTVSANPNREGNLASIELSLIVPTFNESANIEELLRRIDLALSGRVVYEVVLVDDDSPDGTAGVAQSLSEQFPVRVFVRKNERGLASAVLEGFRQARGDIIGTINADLQHPPETLRELLRSVRQGADVVVASRYEAGGSIEEWTLARRIASHGARQLAYLFAPSSRRSRDPLSGYYLLRRSVVSGLNLRPIGYKTLLEILVRGKPEVVASVPYSFADRKAGQSKCGRREYTDYLRHLACLMVADPWLRRFIKFCIVGTGGVAVNMGLLWLLTETVGLYYLVASAIAVECAILNNFFWNDAWTFRDRRAFAWRNRMICLAKFNLVSLVGMGINVSVLWLLTDCVGAYYLLSNLLGIMAATGWRFLTNSRWTWALKPRVA